MTRFRRFSAALLGLGCAWAAWSQTAADPRSRGMQSQVFRSSRDSAAKAAASPAATKGKGKTVNASKGGAKGPASEDPPMLGVNLWRVVPAAASAPARLRGFKHRTKDPEGKQEWTAERVSMQNALARGQMVRFSFEPGRAGYLYVIDRDVFADGSKGAPTLRFPTTQLRGGDNRVEPGLPVVLPGPADDPPVFEVEDAPENQTGIELMMILAPQPLPGIRIGSQEQVLSEAEVTEWIRRWSSGVQMTEDPAMAGSLYTVRERDATEGGQDRLSGNDPVPMTLFYRPSSPDQPMVAMTTIRISGRSGK